MGTIQMTFGEVIERLKKSKSVDEWNETREQIKENLPFDKFLKYMNLLESTGFIRTVLRVNVNKEDKEILEKVIENLKRYKL